eukprot:g17696.t1
MNAMCFQGTGKDKACRIVEHAQGVDSDECGKAARQEDEARSTEELEEERAFSFGPFWGAARGVAGGVGTPMWCPPATWTLSWLGLLGLAGGATAPLPGHSIPNPPDVHHLAKLWQLTGTAMPAHNSVILTPGVADRVGTIFSRMPLKTNDFEASFTLVARAGVPGFQGDGFAFWYQHYAMLDLSEFGYKTHYKGLGVFFVKDDQGQPVVQVKYGDGTSSVGHQTPMELRDGYDHQVKVRVTPDTVTVSIFSKGEAKGTVSSPMTLGRAHESTPKDAQERVAGCG